MLFNSVDFIIFFPIVTILYFVLPRKIRYLWLLATSYYFYMNWNAKYALLLLFSTVVTYVSGLLIERLSGTGKKKAVVAGSFVLNLGVLFFYKYINFALLIVTKVLESVHISVRIRDFDLILPVGTSFFTFQALSYTMDVYRGDIHAEKNFFRYALYVSFFPQLVAGPIERSKNLLKQLAVPSNFDFENARDGFLLMLWGYFLKLVLADRIAIFVDAVYTDYTTYHGWYLIVATLLFAIQIYCDFAGYSTIAIGSAQILGIRLMENFDAPYLAESVSGFWRKWHISLTSWFRDYLYIPLGGNRKGRIRKDINRMIVFLVSGLWHGAAFHFVVWGGINGFYQVIGEWLMPVRNRIISALRLHPELLGYRILRVLVTFVLVDFSWIYFRADSLDSAHAIISSIVHANNPWVLFDGSLYELGLGDKSFRLMLFGILVLLFSDIMKRCGICIRQKILEQDYFIRWIVIAVAIAFILTFGIWGSGYNATNFIYFQF